MKSEVGTTVAGAVTVKALDVACVSPADVARSVLEPVVAVEGTRLENVATPATATAEVPVYVATPEAEASAIVAVLEKTAPNWSSTFTTTDAIVWPEVVAVGCVVNDRLVATGVEPTVIVNALVVAKFNCGPLIVSVQLVVDAALIGMLNVATPELFVFVVEPERIDPVPEATVAVSVAVAA